MLSDYQHAFYHWLFWDSGTPSSPVYWAAIYDALDAARGAPLPKSPRPAFYTTIDVWLALKEALTRDMTNH